MATSSAFDTMPPARAPFASIRRLFRARLFGGVFAFLHLTLALIALLDRSGEEVGFSLIFYVFVAVPLFVLSLEMSSKGIMQWHLRDAPPDMPPATPTEAMRFVRLWTARLAKAAGGFALVGVFFFLSPQTILFGIVLIFTAIACTGYLVAFRLAIPNLRQTRRA